jgi:hypothetical protein
MKKSILSFLYVFLICATAILLRPRVSTAQGGGQPPDLISQVSVTRSTNQSTQLLGSSDERIYLNANESASVGVQLSPGNGVVRLRAPEGGSINGQRKIEIDTDQQGRNLSFTFNPGNDTGAFYIEISDNRTTETVAEFWVGPEAPLGRPGPALTFN